MVSSLEKVNMVSGREKGNMALMISRKKGMLLGVANFAIAQQKIPQIIMLSCLEKGNMGLMISRENPGNMALMISRENQENMVSGLEKGNMVSGLEGKHGIGRGP